MVIHNEIFCLNLLNPLFYMPVYSAELQQENFRENFTDPFMYRPENGGMIFCFEMETAAAVEFEPQRKFFPGALIFAGKTAQETDNRNEQKMELYELPRGNYLFTQARELLNKEKIIDMAIEVQQEGLWQRLGISNRYYLRYVYEDQSTVTQIFRPC